ncbi:PAS domain-containing protein [Prolixibacteraceae bacterium JC049]|nr:PAS domain-containing protein [Prolixibacteraceae bacterium JC049]
MVSKNLYLTIIFRVLLLATSIAATCWLCIFHEAYMLGFIIAIFVVIQVFWLIYTLNDINRKIAFFFDAIQNNDSTLHYPEKIKHKSLQELNVSLNKVNKLIQRTKIENIEQEQYFKTLLEHTSTGIITYNDKGFILQANSAAKHLLNYDYLTHLSQLKRVDPKLYQSLKSLSPNDNTLIELENESGRIQLALKCSSFKRKEEELFVVSIHDIRNELDQKEVDTWIRLIRVLTHEIMNSIAPITSLSDTLMRFHQQPSEEISAEIVKENTLKGLTVIKERGEGLMNFVDSYRQLTRLPKPTITAIEMAPFMDRIKLLVSNYSSSQTQINVIVNPNDLIAYADEKLISQVLINITKNAIQSVSNTEKPKVDIIVKSLNNNRTEITISDNGPGISPELIDEIFVPFFTTKESGSGIGLSLSKQIMRLHGGQIKVASTPNQKTTFTLTW